MFFYTFIKNNYDEYFYEYFMNMLLWTTWLSSKFLISLTFSSSHSELHFLVVTVILLHDQDAVMGGAQQAGGFFKSFF